MDPAMNSAGASGALKEEFLELICSDRDLLRAEFEDIISSAWACEPPGATGARTAIDASPTEPPNTSRRIWPLSGALGSRHDGIEVWARPRSPPKTQQPHTAMNQKGR